MDKFHFISSEKIKKQIEFIITIDEMKNILRRNLVVDGSRRENDAEHSWHLAVMAMILEEYSADKVDIANEGYKVSFDNTYQDLDKINESNL